MAIVTGMWLKGSKKRLGGTVIYQAMGQTRQRELAAEVSNPRTEAQMNQRVKWSNLVNFYRANRAWMKYAFETKKPNQTEYNKLMSLNVTASPIFLPKGVAGQGGCVVAPYLITQGSLPSIEWIAAAGNTYQSNIILDAETNLQNVSVSEFAQNLLRNNPAIRQGDQLSLIRNTQMTNPETGVPYIICRVYEVLVDVSNNSSLWNYLPQDIIGSDGAVGAAHLTFSAGDNTGGFAMILSRTISGKTYVSTQRLQVVGNEAVIGLYSGPEALALAIASYGSSEDAFLSTISAQQNSQAVVPLSILSVRAGDGQERAAGSMFVISSRDSGLAVSIVFNNSLPAVPTSVTLVSPDYSMPLNDIAASGQLVTGTLDDGPWRGSRGQVTSLRATIDGLEYRIDFAPYNSGGGLE